ncbi:MAG: NfeD family protein [Pikeienuella sp.]
MIEDPFAWLSGLSPWWWIALGVAIGAAEMLTFTYFLIWIALAAIATGAAAWLFPGLSVGAQFGLFALLAIGLTVAGRYWLRGRGTQNAANGLNRRSDQLVGRSGRAAVDFDAGEGAVEIDGVRWPARLSAGEAVAGARLAVIGAEGTLLICAPRGADDQETVSKQ